jgi:hypothetical protein
MLKLVSRAWDIAKEVVHLEDEDNREFARVLL